jgi:uroporphyrinogen-III synthase
VIFTSSEGLRNFCQRLGAAGAAYIRDTPLIVPHPRIAAAARGMGLNCVVQSAAGDEALLTTVLRQVSG